MLVNVLSFEYFTNSLSATFHSVIGLSDGLTVPFALTAGLSSLGESKLVILGGFAELIAGAISMGIGGFLASQAERDHYLYLRKHTASRVSRSCDGEMEREGYPGHLFTRRRGVVPIRIVTLYCRGKSYLV